MAATVARPESGLTRVAKVAELVERGGAKFNMTLDHSHVIFKIGNLHERPIDDAESEPSGDVDIDLPIGSNGEGMLAGGSARTQVIDADGGGLGRPWEEALRRGICTDNGETQVRLRRTAMATRR